MGVLLVLILAGTFAHADVSIDIEIHRDRSMHTISPMAFGQHLIYPSEPDRLYDSGFLPGLIKDMGATFLRWPGGTVTTYYHWNQLTGNGWEDTWNPDYQTSDNKDASTYMDVDEYIHLLGATGAQAMLGINLSSAVEWKTVDAGIAEAKALLEHFRSNGVRVGYVYLDNETYHFGNQHNKDPNGDGAQWTAETYAGNINRYAPMIRDVFPGARIIANWDNRFRGNSKRTKELSKLVKLAGSNIDYIDTHWKWGRRWGSWTTWKATTPMQFDYYDKSGNLAYDGLSLMEEKQSFDALMKKAGHPNIKLASLEWNLAPGPWQGDPRQTPFRTALMQAEIFLQLITANIEVASFFSLHSPVCAQTNNRFVLDTADDYRVNPLADVFRLTRHLKGKRLFRADHHANGVVTIAAEGDSVDEYFVYVLNKTDSPANVKVSLSPAGRQAVQTDKVMALTESGVGKLQVSLSADGRIPVPPNSLTFASVRRAPKH
ncbi:MAG: hypothetical protein R3E46_03520 [Sedimenticolaceae bacterium]